MPNNLLFLKDFLSKYLDNYYLKHKLRQNLLIMSNNNMNIFQQKILIC